MSYTSTVWPFRCTIACVELEIVGSDIHSSRRAGEEYRRVAQLSFRVSTGALALKKAARRASGTAGPLLATEADRNHLVELLQSARASSVCSSGADTASAGWEQGVDRLVERLSRPLVEMADEDLEALDTVCAALDREASNRFRHLEES